jgi:hypothetical protein
MYRGRSAMEAMLADLYKDLQRGGHMEFHVGGAMGQQIGGLEQRGRGLENRIKLV